jgi:hypothetical protein
MLEARRAGCTAVKVQLKKTDGVAAYNVGVKDLRATLRKAHPRERRRRCEPHI